MCCLHCEDVDANPDSDMIKLTWEEFQCQTEAKENDFGPCEDLETIWDEHCDMPYPVEDSIKMWRLKHNRYVEVQRKKKRL